MAKHHGREHRSQRHQLKREEDLDNFFQEIEKHKDDPRIEEFIVKVVELRRQNKMAAVFTVAEEFASKVLAEYLLRMSRGV